MATSMSLTPKIQPLNPNIIPVYSEMSMECQRSLIVIFYENDFPGN